MFRYFSLLTLVLLMMGSMSQAFVIDQRGPSSKEKTEDEFYEDYQGYQQEDPELSDENFDPELDDDEGYDPDLDGNYSEYRDENADESETALSEPGLVEQEYYIYKVSTDINKVLAPYRDRRSDWGFSFNFGWSYYVPSNYQPNFQPDFDFEGLYATRGMFELGFQLGRHLSFGTVGIALGTGFSQSPSNDKPPQENTLQVIPIRLEANVVLDMIFAEPIVAPYASLGVYSNIYKEEQAGVSFNGNTQAAMYYGVGINIQLDWLEPVTSVRSYMNYGLENTFIYIEGKQYLSSATESDPDFGTSLVLAGGMRLEY